MNSMKMVLTAIGLVGVLATPALAGSHERNHYYARAEHPDFVREDRDFAHEQARHGHAAAHKASSEQKGPSYTHAVVKAACECGR